MLPLSSEKNRPLWHQVLKENFTSLGALIQFLELSEENAEKLYPFSHFPLNVPRRLAEKMEKNNPSDPIFLQFTPLLEEGIKDPGFVEDPVKDLSFRKSKKLLKKYEGRALLLTASACAMNCRFCFRQNFPYEKETYGFEEELSLIREDRSISELILSGGDPLSLSNAALRNLFSSLESIPHVKRIRFHSRFPIGIPERIDNEFLALLESTEKKFFFILHCNHPKELDKEVVSAIGKMRSLGIPILNQSVLLRGVNVDPKTLLALSEALIDAQILPYYLHLLDPVRGTGHFLVSENEAKELIRFLQTNLSGFGVPRLVREVPGGLSKSFISI